MRCPKCFSEYTPGTASCPKCGTILAESERRMPEPVKTKPKWLYPLIGGLAAVVLIAVVAAWALSGKSATNAPPTPVSGPSVTNAPVTPGGSPSVTNAPPVATSPVTTPENPGNKVPQDVLDYLNFVKGIEAKRHALLRDTSRALSMSATSQAKGLSDMIDWVMDEDSSAPKDPLAGVKQELGTHVTSWQGLLKEFESKPSPQSCSAFAGAYRQGLTSESVAIGRVAGVMNGIDINKTESMEQALAALRQMKSENMQGNIDSAVENADRKLGELCAGYGISKPFDVKKETDVGGSITGGL